MREKKKNLNYPEDPNFWNSALALQGSVTPKVYKNVLLCILYSVLVSLILFQFPMIRLPISPFEYAGVIMGLTLVFRINSGYDRWWEARKIWGDIVNTERNLATVVACFGQFSSKIIMKRHLQLIAALPFLMKNHLRSIQSVTEVESLLSKKDYEQIQNSNHKPNYIAFRIAEFLSSLYNEKKISEFAFLRAEHLREKLINSQGACERILKTPMPLVMAIKIRRFIFLFLLILPIALADNILINVMVTALVAYALLSLDQIGIELQNPFAIDNLSHLPLNEICNNIKKDIAEIAEF